MYIKRFIFVAAEYFLSGDYNFQYFVVSPVCPWGHGLRRKKFYDNVAVPPVKVLFDCIRKLKSCSLEASAFKERLHRLGLAEDSRCSCPLGGPETPEHIL